MMVGNMNFGWRSLDNNADFRRASYSSLWIPTHRTFFPLTAVCGFLPIERDQRSQICTPTLIITIKVISWLSRKDIFIQRKYCEFDAM